MHFAHAELHTAAAYCPCETVSSRTSSPISCRSSLPNHIRPFFLGKCFSRSTFTPAMGLLDLDKIIIKRTVLGIRCTACGGNLVASEKKTIAGWLMNVISFGAIQPKTYECETCRKRFLFYDE